MGSYSKVYSNNDDKDRIIKLNKEKDQNRKDEFKDQIEALKHANEFIIIYTSKNKKKSVNINVVRAEKIQKFVVEEYQMDNNESEITNPELIIELLKNRVK